tara:strand:- start:73 stop:279 length:207 start_codon:yes stop_codon:yes gene_type:complete
MKVGDLVRLRVIEFNDVGEIFNVYHKGLILSGAYDYGWVEVLFFDGEHQFYDDSDPEWEDFFEVLSES